MRVPMVSKRPTSANVAALAGVSRTTVSFVLNGRYDISVPLATRRRVVDAAHALGYRPSLLARRLAGGRSQVLGVMVRQEADGDTEEL